MNGILGAVLQQQQQKGAAPCREMITETTSATMKTAFHSPAWTSKSSSSTQKQLIPYLDHNKQTHPHRHSPSGSGVLVVEHTTITQPNHSVLKNSLLLLHSTISSCEVAAAAIIIIKHN